MQCDSSRGIISEYCMGGLVPSLTCLCSLVRMIHLVVLRPCDKQISRNIQSPSHLDACCAKPCVLTRTTGWKLDSPWILIFPSFGDFFFITKLIINQLYPKSVVDISMIDELKNRSPDSEKTWYKLFFLAVKSFEKPSEKQPSHHQPRGPPL